MSRHQWTQGCQGPTGHSVPERHRRWRPTDVGTWTSGGGLGPAARASAALLSEWAAAAPLICSLALAPLPGGLPVPTSAPLGAPDPPAARRRGPQWPLLPPGQNRARGREQGSPVGLSWRGNGQREETPCGDVAGAGSGAGHSHE